MSLPATQPRRFTAHRLLVNNCILYSGGDCLDRDLPYYQICQPCRSWLQGICVRCGGEYHTHTARCAEKGGAA